MATAQDIVNEFRTAVAAVTTARNNALTFRQVPFNKGGQLEPQAGAEQYHVSANSQGPTQWFGAAGTKQDELSVVVELLHPPAGDERVREGYIQRDLERLRDILEGRAWTAAGVQAVFFAETLAMVRMDSGWRSTQLRFRVVYTGTVATS